MITCSSYQYVEVVTTTRHPQDVAMVSRAWRHAVRDELGTVTPVLFKGWILVRDFASSLQVLDLRGCENHLTDSMCEYLGDLPHVQRIHLATGPHVTGAGTHVLLTGVVHKAAACVQLVVCALTAKPYTHCSMPFLYGVP